MKLRVCVRGDTAATSVVVTPVDPASGAATGAGGVIAVYGCQEPQALDWRLVDVGGAPAAVRVQACTAFDERLDPRQVVDGCQRVDGPPGRWTEGDVILLQ
jgi:hypothetical protein